MSDLHWAVTTAIVLACIMLIYGIFKAISKPTPVKLSGKHVIITGGSKGIGLSITRSLIHDEKVSHVSIIARDKATMEQVQAELGVDKISIYPCDITDYKQVKKVIGSAEASNGPVEIAISCAGMSIPGYFLDQDPSIFQKQMNVNYMGTVNFCSAVIPSMVKSKKGTLVLVSSGICAGTFVGYASYAPTKTAVRALADTLRSELQGFNISVHISFPPDTNTPGFENEQLTKPKETMLITPPELFEPKAVAIDMLKRLKRGDYQLLSLNLETNLSLMLTAGIAPRNDLLLECFVAPLMTMVQAGWRVFHADKIAKQYGVNYDDKKNN